MKKTKAFGLLEIIIIMVITAMVASIATGVIMLNSPQSRSGGYKNYTNDEELKDFLDVYDTIISKYYDKVDKKGMLKAAEEAMLNFLGDKYTTYLEDSEYNNILNELSGNSDGIGVSIRGNIIMKVIVSSPAEKAGLEVNDEIIEINGIDVRGANSDTVGNLIRNETKETISLKVLRNGVELSFNIKKEKYTVTSTKIKNTSIGYIYIKNFSENLSELVSEALRKLENDGITSLIIDVRDNVGGYLTSAEETASLFIAKGKTIYSLKNSSNTMVYEDETGEKREYPIIILINGNSASASEILAAALKDSYGAILVGTTSYGKGLVQQVMNLNGGGSIKTTTAKWYTPNGVCIDGIGINPDYFVTYANGTPYDTQLTKAIELLSAS